MTVVKRRLYNMSKRKYEPYIDGVVMAIRIYYSTTGEIMADLVFSYGGKETIEWTNVAQREHFNSGINGYTLYYDEREKVNFSSFAKQVKA